MADIDTLRRLVGCRSWRWMGGARWILHRAAPLEPVTGRVTDCRPRDGSGVPVGALPDPTDPATVGCLLAIAREATGCPGLVARLTSRGKLAVWIVDCVGCPAWLDEIMQATEAGALIAAIIAADAAGSTP